MPISNNNTAVNSGQFSSRHMERAGDNKYSESDSSVKPAAGERSKTLITDGRPAGTHFRDNSWFDGGAGNRGSRASELAKYSGTSSAKQSDNDAPFMRGDRARSEDGTLREVRADQTVANNPTLSARAPDLMAEYGDVSVGDLRNLFGGMSVSKIGEMTQVERADYIDQNADQGKTDQNVGKGDFSQSAGGITAQIAQLRCG